MSEAATSAGDVRSINCTNCGAGLPVLGGGRVTTQVCGYCGASLDATDAFKVLEVFAEMDRPDTPFKLGMEGELNGVRFTITGIIGMTEPGYGDWVDHMLHSPTHGYAWLTLENGHCVFTRKVRDLPRGKWLSSRLVESSESKPGRAHRGRNYIYYDTTDWRIASVEGGFNFRPSRGDRGCTIAMVSYGDSGAQMLAYVEPQGEGREREVEISTYAPEAPAAFGVDAPVPEGIHPLQPYEGAKGKGFYRFWFGLMTAASLAMALYIGFGGGTNTVASGQVGSLPAKASFEITDASRPVWLEFETDLSNSWAEFDLTVTSPGGTNVIDEPVGLSYYWGYSDGERWSEGSPRKTYTFLPPEVGEYSIVLPAAKGEALTQNKISEYSVVTQESIKAMRWPVLATILFVILFIGSFLSKTLFAMRRASGGDWTED